MWRVTNTANDRSKVHLHRLASKFTYEPSIGGLRLRLGESVELEDAHFEAIRAQLEGWKGKGIVDFERVGGEVKKAPVETKKVEEEPRAGTPEPQAAAVEAHSDPTEGTTPKKSQGKKKFF
jgi:hypothetical protein